MPREVCRLIVLGSTGSIGTQTLEVVEHLNTLHARGEWATRYEVVGLAAGKNESLLRAQADKFQVRRVVSEGNGSGGAEKLVHDAECDIVVAAMSGVAGLPATMTAVQLGRDVALANKETLVAAGELVVAAAKKSGARLLPVDSEHAGLWQCLDRTSQDSPAAPPMEVGDEVARVVLTASGGPFRTWSREQLERATPEEALKHPTWSMGKKVTIDSATLMNKALEIIEAHWLFGLSGDQIAAMVHPQSMVHALVEFCDGSVIAQLASPDMKLPIQNAITWSCGRADACSRRMKWEELRKLEFEEPDLARFPGLALAHRAIEEGNGAVLNAANEAAVGAFLLGKIGFLRIAELAQSAMEKFGRVRPRDLADVMRIDAEVKSWAADRIERSSR
jgi:1-deoxy-D-xylulose-5-phosphate reductoisomerase